MNYDISHVNIERVD